MPKQKKTLTNNTSTHTQIHTHTNTDTHREYVWKKSLYNPNSWKSQTGSTARHRLDIARSRKLNNPNGRINKTQNAGRHRSHSPSLSCTLFSISRVGFFFGWRMTHRRVAKIPSGTGKSLWSVNNANFWECRSTHKGLPLLTNVCSSEEVAVMIVGSTETLLRSANTHTHTCVYPACVSHYIDHIELHFRCAETSTQYPRNVPNPLKSCCVRPLDAQGFLFISFWLLLLLLLHPCRESAPYFIRASEIYARVSCFN